MLLPHVWNPDYEAVWRENAPGTTRAITLRHPTYPYEGPNQGAIPDDHSDTLIDFAATYLRKVSSTLGLTAALGVSDILQQGSSKFLDTVPLVWLPVHAAEGVPATHDSSFWVTRYPENSTSRLDRTAVILAVQSAKANDSTQVLGSRLGIRIVAHVSPSASGPLKAQITGASCSIGLPDALALNVPAASAFLHIFFGDVAARSAAKVQIREVAGFSDYNPVFYDGLRVIGASDSRAIIDLYLTVLPRLDEPEAPAFAVTAQLLVGGSGDPELRKLEKWPLVAHAGPVLARVFTIDLASKAGLGKLIDSRPNRSPQRLKPYLDTRTLAGVTLGLFFDTVLHDDLDQVAVKQSKLVDPGANEGADQVVAPPCVTHPRLNWFAAISAYQHTRGLQPSVGLALPGLLDTMRAYGLLPSEYFRFASLPLRVRFRAPIDHGGKDGKIVNAQVNFEGLKGDRIATTETAPPLPLRLKFALADVKRTASRRQPLGIAADPRWCWHEGGHVLLGASTGALQFRFAHSAGDALAAVLSDPDSALATHRRMRGLTFPWVYIHRRHDRSVFRGWSWSGRYHRQGRFPTDVNSYPRKGYQSEQILSTTLFRLYRALGGDTTLAGGAPDTASRRRAADYTAYLIMKAIRFMPQAFLAPLETPDQLVSALTDADRSTLPATFGPLAGRVGGWAFKVVRWAFEAQGLFATSNLLDVVDAPGKPQDRDVFIDDRRPHSEGNFPRGGYMPVSLDWQPVPNPPIPEPSPAVPPNPPNPPLWHATADAIRVVGNAVTVVEVSSRGPSPTTGVTVQVWWNDWPSGNPPAWNNGTWNLLGTSAQQPVAPWPARTQFGPFSATGPADLPTAPSGRRLLIVATATCAADPANSEASTTLHCSTLPTPIVDLVAGDNNIGLRRHDIP